MHTETNTETYLDGIVTDAQSRSDQCREGKDRDDKLGGGGYLRHVAADIYFMVIL
jgi:hypothetical protein